MILNCGDLSDRVGSMAKTKQDNNMIECLGVVYAETETKLSGPIKRGVVCYQNQIEKQHDKLYKCDLH